MNRIKYLYEPDEDYRASCFSLIKNYISLLILLILLCIIVYWFCSEEEKENILILVFCIVLFYVPLIILEIQEVCVNERIITVDESGLTIKLFNNRKHYSWGNINTVSFENPIDVRKNDSGSPKYPGRVIILYPGDFKRKKYNHPFVANLKHPLNMVCIYLDGSKNNKYYIPNRRGNGIDMWFFALYENRDMSLLESLEEWGVKLTYDYRKDYCEEYNNKPLNSVYDRIMLQRIEDFRCHNGNSTEIVYAMYEKDILGVWKGNGESAVKTALKSLRERGVKEIHSLYLRSIEPEWDRMIREEFPETVICRCLTEILDEYLRYLPLEKQRSLEKELKRILNSPPQEKDRIIIEALREYSEYRTFTDHFVQNTESLKSISLYTGNSGRYEKAEKRIESLQHKEKCSESDVCGFVLWELLKMKKNKTKEDNDLIWKLGNQLKHW